MHPKRIYGAEKTCAQCDQRFRVELATATSSTPWRTIVLDPVTYNVVAIRNEVEVHYFCQLCWPTAA